jgi:hypothetical protein
MVDNGTGDGMPNLKFHLPLDGAGEYATAREYFPARSGSGFEPQKVVSMQISSERRFGESEVQKYELFVVPEARVEL